MQRLDAAITHVLVGTDGSAFAAEAVRQGARLARLFDAPLDVAHVFDTDRPALTTFREAPDARSRADDVLSAATEGARSEGIEPTTRVLAGGRTPALVHDAREHGVDLIAVGANGGFFDRLHLRRGVAAQTVREASCSVLVARARRRADGSVSPFPSRILCATDGSDASLESARQAAEIARAADAELAILHVTSAINLFGVAASGAEDGMMAAEAIAEAARVVRSAGVEPSSEIVAGRPGGAIVQTATGWGADLVVVGSHGRHGLPRVLLGSVSEWVAGHSWCSVLVARPSRMARMGGGSRGQMGGVPSVSGVRPGPRDR